MQFRFLTPYQAALIGDGAFGLRQFAELLVRGFDHIRIIDNPSNIFWILS